MKTIGVFEAKTHLSQLLVRVENAEEFIIQKRGKNIAVLQPFNKLNKKKKKEKEQMILSAFREIRESQKKVNKKKESVKELINSGRKW